MDPQCLDPRLLDFDLPSGGDIEVSKPLKRVCIQISGCNMFAGDRSMPTPRYTSRLLRLKILNRGHNLCKRLQQLKCMDVWVHSSSAIRDVSKVGPKECQPHWFLPVAPVEGRIAAAMVGLKVLI